jgi:hypothetical protein
MGKEFNSKSEARNQKSGRIPKFEIRSFRKEANRRFIFPRHQFPQRISQYAVRIDCSSVYCSNGRTIMSQSCNERGGTERWVGFVILLCLAGIAAGVFLKQFSFNPAVLVATAAAAEAVKTVSSPSPGETPPTLPPELAALSAPETFAPDDLFNKIDGKADLYLTAGFVQLRCQRFALKAASDTWMEWFVYDMGALPQAFSVFSLQRRSEAQALDLTEFAYQTQNSLYFVCGRYYVEAETAMPTEPMMAAMRAMARQFVAANPPGATRIPELKLFPPENLEAGSQGLQVADAFGFDRFTNVFTAKYRLPSGTNNAEGLAFLEMTKTPADAAALRDAYRSFLLANGGKEIESQNTGSIGKPIEFMGNIEIIFSEGNAVAGVHAAPDAASAAKVAQSLADGLRKGKK